MLERIEQERLLLPPGQTEGEIVPNVLIEAMAIFDSKASLDIKLAEKRAAKCGCRNCRGDVQRIKESWYGEK